MDDFVYKKFLICRASEDKLIRIKLRKQLFAFASEEGGADSESEDVPSVEEIAAKPLPSNDVSEELELLRIYYDDQEYWHEKLNQKHFKNKFYLKEDEGTREGSDKETVRPAKHKKASSVFLKKLKNI
jgi:hypothetical protein